MSFFFFSCSNSLAALFLASFSHSSLLLTYSSRTDSRILFSPSFRCKLPAEIFVTCFICVFVFLPVAKSSFDLSLALNMSSWRIRFLVIALRIQNTRTNRCHCVFHYTTQVLKHHAVRGNLYLSNMEDNHHHQRRVFIHIPFYIHYHGNLCR